MDTFTQAARPLEISTPLGPDALLLVGLEGHEAISELFSYRLDTLAPGKPVAFDTLLGKAATVRLEVPGSGKRFIHGIVSKLTQKGPVFGRTEGTPLIRYQLELVPALWLLTRRHQSRIFQHLSVPDILRTVLHDQWGLDVDLRIQYQFPPRVRVVQYRETDFAFVSRLMEDEGIHYFFEHSESKHRLVLRDSSAGPPTLPGPSDLLYDNFTGGTRPENRIYDWEKTQEVRSYRSTLWDHCFELPGVHLEAIENIPDAVTAGKVTHHLAVSHTVNQREMLEFYDYPGGYSHRFDGIDRQGAEVPDELQKIYQDNVRTASLRAQQQATEALVLSGSSTIGHLLPGYQFSLLRHFDGDGAYLLTRVEHTATLDGAYSTGSQENFRYDNRFRCAPVELSFRPPLVTPRPTVQGTQTATVVGPEGAEIHCDKYGRVKVQFHWDRTGFNQASGGKHILHDSSCWVRVSQAWAGKNFGSIHIPRIGQEVIIAFLEGDPDKPIIVGCVYNADQETPYKLPDHRTHTGLKSHSRFGNAADFSHLTFEDFKDREHVHMHSQQDMTHSAEQHLIQNVGGQHHLHVAKTAVRQVGGLPGLDHAVWIGRDDAASRAAVGGGTSTGPVDETWANWAQLTPEQQKDLVDKEIASQTAGPFYTISPSSLFGSSWAGSLDTVFGWRTGNTVGLYTTVKLGVNQSTTINPLALADVMPGTTGLAAVFSILDMVTLGPLLRNSMGCVNVIMGTNSTIHYGRKFDFSYGTNVEVRQDFTKPTYALAIIAGLLYNTAALGELFLPAIKNSLAAEITAGLDAGIDLIAFNMWVVALADSWLVSFVTNAEIRLYAAAKVSLQTMLANRQNARIVEDQIEEESDNNGPEIDPTAKSEWFDSTYTVGAPCLTLLSSPTASNAADPIGILVQANGIDGLDGEVVIYGTGKASLIGGDQAYVQCVTEEEVTGKVTIDCGAVGTITLQSGLTQEPNCVTLSPEGISLSSLLEIKASVEENSLSMNPAEIMLSSGPSSISITPEGITLACGPSSIAITLEGVTISGPMLSLSGDALVTIG